MLSKWSRYSAYLVFKLLNHAWGLSHPLQEVSVTVGAHVSGFSVRLMEEPESSRLGPNLVPDEADEPQLQAQRDRGMVGKPQTRQDGWMEILLGEFCNEEGDDGDVTMSFSGIKGVNYKRGLIVQGIEIRPPKK